MTHDIRVNGARLWDSIMEMAEIGATANGGSHRLTLSDEDKTGRDLFASWCAEAGLTLSVDEMGDMFARRAGASMTSLSAGRHRQPPGYAALRRPLRRRLRRNGRSGGHPHPERSRHQYNWRPWRWSTGPMKKARVSPPLCSLQAFTVVYSILTGRNHAQR